MQFAKFLAALIALGTALLANAASVRPLAFDEVVDGAAIAFHGICVANRVEVDAGTRLIVTITTFEVREALKGRVTATHEIKQIGGILPGGTEGLIVHGVPKFAPGSEYVVFLPEKSSLGFSSPVGLSQGQFSVQETALGRRVVGSVDLAEPARAFNEDTAPAVRRAAATLALDDFKRRVRTRGTALE